MSTEATSRHHFKIRIPCDRYRWPYQMKGVEPVPPDMAVECWYEGEDGVTGSVVYEGSHSASSESLAIVQRLMEAAR